MNLAELYIDQQGLQSTYFADRVISSAYAPHGIKLIDSNFAIRVRNINVPVKQVYARHRVKDTFWGHDGKEHESYNSYKTVFEEIHFTATTGHNDYKVVWENGSSHVFTNGNNSPRFINLETKTECPETLYHEIMSNPHLHEELKNNLISNLVTRPV